MSQFICRILAWPFQREQKHQGIGPSWDNGCFNFCVVVTAEYQMGGIGA